MNFPILYGKDKNNNIKTWYTYISKLPDDNYICYIEYGRLNGKCQQTSQIYRNGKNIGKSNQTTIYEQCVLETTKKWNDKKKEGYIENLVQEIKEGGEEDKYKQTQSITQDSVVPVKEILNTNVYLPMLANTFNLSNPKHINKFPCFVQPKLDGVRCICYLNNTKDKVLSQSRTGNFFTSLSHITDSLFHNITTFPTNNNIILDGELYTNQLPFEELVGLVKQKNIKLDDVYKYSFIKYHVYDIIIKNISFEIRNQILQSFVNYSKNDNICFVKTEEVSNIDEFKSAFNNYISDGYEGIMVRTKEGEYVCNYRSSDLLKYKQFVENEYKIVGFSEGTGRDSGTVIWICINENGDEFHVRPRGTIQNRKDMFNNGNSYIGKWLTVIYQELSERNIPRFPVGKCIREQY